MTAGSVLLGGRYEVGRRVGRGGMAEVFEAHDRLLDRRVAVKILHPHLADDGELLERFRNEARVWAPLAHNGIVAVHDAGEQDGLHYLVLEYVDGRTLADLIAEGPLAPADAVRIFHQVCVALGAAHERGVVHRDVKPANVMVTPFGTAKVMDFGIARLVDAVTMSRTNAMVLGTPQFMSPEQFRGEPPDARSDLYALGVCLYAALTGRVPFSAPNPLVVAALHVNEPPLAPRLHVPELPAGLEAVALRALAKEPAERYQTAAALAAALADVDLAAEAEAAPGPSRPRRGLRLLTAAAALAAVTLLVIGGLPTTGADGTAMPAAAADRPAVPVRVPAPDPSWSPAPPAAAPAGPSAAELPGVAPAAATGAPPARPERAASPGPPAGADDPVATGGPTAAATAVPEPSASPTSVAEPAPPTPTPTPLPLPLPETATSTSLEEP